MKKLIGFVCLILILSGCSDDPCGPCDGEESSFEVRILSADASGEPVEGVWIVGGVDWGAFEVRTDSQGMAVLPSRALGVSALIHRSNYLPKVIDLRPGAYGIVPTAKRLEYVGKISDRAIRFTSDMLLTLERNGKYRAYSYSDTSVTELVKTLIPVLYTRSTKFYGDTLWFSTQDEGIHAYSVEDPLNPVHLFSLDIPGHLHAFAVGDGFIAVSDPYGDGPVRVYSYTTAGEISKISEIEALYVRQMDLRSNYLVILSYDRYELGSVTLRIVDISVLAEPTVTYTLEERGALGGLLLDETVLIGPFVVISAWQQSYTTVDIQDPGNPVYMGRSYSDSWLLDASGESHAVGAYCPQRRRCEDYSDAYSVLELTPEGDWRTVATLSKFWYMDECVQSPPYFVLGARLWRLRDR